MILIKTPEALLWSSYNSINFHVSMQTKTGTLEFSLAQIVPCKMHETITNLPFAVLDISTYQVLTHQPQNLICKRVENFHARN